MIFHGTRTIYEPPDESEPGAESRITASCITIGAARILRVGAGLFVRATEARYYDCPKIGEIWSHFWPYPQASQEKFGPKKWGFGVPDRRNIDLTEVGPLTPWQTQKGLPLGLSQTFFSPLNIGHINPRPCILFESIYDTHWLAAPAEITEQPKYRFSTVPPIKKG